MEKASKASRQEEPVCPGCCDVLSSPKALGCHKDGDGLYRLYHCRKCDLQFWHPRKTDSRYYQRLTSGVYDASVGPHGLNIWHTPFFRRFPLNGGRLLDVGCGDGAFIAKALERGFDVTGIDFDGEVIKAIVRDRNINARAMSLEQLAAAADGGCADGGREKFDVVTFFEVLEHQDDLLKFLEQVRMLMNKGGWIAGTVPNRNRFIIKREYQDYPPNHFIYFSRQSLKNLLERAAFTDIEIHDREYGLLNLSIYLENQIMGRASESVKSFLKKIFFKAGASQSKALSIECLKGRSAAGYFLLRAMRVLRNIFFFFPALLLYPVIRPHLYFQAHLKDDEGSYL